MDKQWSVFGFDCWVNTYPTKENDHVRQARVVIDAFDWAEIFDYHIWISDSAFTMAVHETVRRFFETRSVDAYVSLPDHFGDDDFSEEAAERGYLPRAGYWKTLLALGHGAMRCLPNFQSPALVVPIDLLGADPFKLEGDGPEDVYNWTNGKIMQRKVLRLDAPPPLHIASPLSEWLWFWCHYPDRNITYLWNGRRSGNW